MDLSVIIVNYNVRHYLEQCLHTVIKASENITCEIFVVDNYSSDDSCRIVKNLFPDIKLICNSGNYGFSAANNQAIRLSRGKFILLLNPDTLVEEEAFTRCLAFMAEHPAAGALGVRMINGNGKLLPESKRALPTPGTAFFKMSGLSFLFPHSGLFNRYYLGHLDSSATTETEIISGAFMFIRKEVLEKTGLMDETFFMYGEDIDLSYRILQAGYKNFYFPGVRIIHYKGESTSKGDINYVVQFYKAMLIFVRKHITGSGKKSLLLLISAAVYFWGFIAILKNFLLKIITPLYRLLISVPGAAPIRNYFSKTRRIIVIGSNDVLHNIINLVNSSGIKSVIVGRLRLVNDKSDNDSLGTLDRVMDIVKEKRIDEVIFSCRELTTCEIISSMELLSQTDVIIKIAPAGENLIIGSKAILNKS
jgi:O-antigen biosynthesis protein